MPYLYRQAVLSHEEGTPMMRPMFVEFPEDRACETLDKQYMLGDSLLAAPVFKESGEVEYYLPEGKWYNILTDKTVEGGKWQKETHDYFSMPLLVRPNTILAVGSNDAVPEYDYTDGVTLYLACFEEGKEAETVITDLTGNTVMTVKASRNGDTITVHAEGGNRNFKCEVLGDEELKVVVE